MALTEQSQTPIIALLSAANATGDGQNAAAGVAMTLAGGEPLLAHQITELRRHGIVRFLIEVDSVSGALLALADKFRNRGCSIDFVRSASDLQPFLRLNESVLVQSEALYLSSGLLEALLAETKPFIATLDGRDENASFERMDLNTRWAGLAVIGASTVSLLGALPEGWSITSSLLRQAIQDRVRFVPLPQQQVQTGELRLISTAADAASLSQQILIGRGRRHSGFVETNMFGPMAVRFAPYIWQSPSGSNLIDASALVFAGASLGLAAIGWNISAISTAIFTIFLNIVRTTTRDPEQNSGIARYIEPIIWLFLGIGAVVAARGDFSYSSDGTFAALIMIGLALLAQQLSLPNWAQYILKSPALLAVTALIVTPFAGFAQAAQWIAVTQLCALILAKWAHKLPVKKAEQA
jgi:hypothetical protein